MSIKEIKMTNVACAQATHQSKAIDALCLNPECKENAALCSKCLINPKNHPLCRQQVNDLEVIPNQLMGLQQLSFDIVMLQEMINQQFKELLSNIEQLILPISNYQNTPNLTNLNEIGYLLKKNPKQTILQLIDETKIQIKSLFDNRDQIQQNSNPKRKLKLVEQKYVEPEKKVNEWYYKGFLLYQESKYSEAIVCFDQAIQMDPNDLDSWYSKGCSLYYQGEYSDTIACFDQAIKMDPNHFESWYYKGCSLYYQGEYSETIACFDQVIKMDPNHYKSWCYKGCSLYYQGEYSDTIACFDQAIKMDPNHFESWYYKGCSLYYQGEYSETIACFDQAIKMNPNHFKSWCYKGCSLYYQGEYSEAIACFDQAIKMDPNHFESWYYKGCSLSNLGRFEEAIKSYEQCNRIHPNYSHSKLQEAEEALRKQKK